MRTGGVPRARLPPLALVALLAFGADARAQDLAPAPAAPLPVPEALAPNPASSPAHPEGAARERAVQAEREAAEAPPPALSIGADALPLPSDGKGTTSLKYLLQGVEIVGNRRTRSRLIKTFVPIDTGAALDVGDPEIEALRYRLLGTGWYDRVELRLKRGAQPGWVVLVIEVEERSTLVFQQLAAGVGWSVEGVSKKEGGASPPKREPEPYLGLSIADTNFLGTGRTLSGELLVSPDQQGVSLTFFAPAVRHSRWSLRGRGTFVNGREYFGGDNADVSADCPEPLPGQKNEPCEISTTPVLEYYRTGLSIGTSRDVGSFTRLSLEWHGDFVHVPNPPTGMPFAATTQRGRGPLASVPIDFFIEAGNSYVSMLTVGLLYDKRDSAILPTRGGLAAFNGDLASGLIASDYQFARMQASYNHWFPLPWGHTIRVGAFAGALFGRAPFFYKFFVTDLTDLQPTRILGLNLDHRPPPNLIGRLRFRCDKPNSECGTAIAEMRQEELAGRIDAEYVWPIVRGRRRFLKSADAFFLFGLYGLADADDLQVAVPGYEGFLRLPIDITLDAGVRLDTHVGVFQIGLAKLAWLPVR